jgi:segregation and condensation protein A
MSEYKIKLDGFEGPMALLLHLIEKNKIDIYDIPIAMVTEQYLEYLQAMEEFDIDVASEFLVMAATLLQIKSRMLLPKPPQTPENLTEAEDPRQELVERLLEYRKFKEMSARLGDMILYQERLFTRSPQEFPAETPKTAGLVLEDLVRAFLAVWESSIDDYALVTREEFSVQDKMSDIMQLLHRNQGQVEFSCTIIRKGTRSEVIAAFLALLELMKLQRVTIVQKCSFAPITIMLRK